MSFQQDNNIIFINLYTNQQVDNISSNPTRTLIPELCINYSLSSKFAVGISFLYYTLKEIDNNNESDNTTILSSIKTYGRSFSAYCTFNQFTYNPYNLSFWGNFSFEYLAGLSYGTVNNEYYNYIAKHYESHTYVFDETLIGIMLGAKLDYYFYDFVSIYANLNGYAYYPQDEINHPITNNKSFKITSKKLNNSCLNVFFGLSLHI